LDASETAPFLVTAKQQTAGQGRLGRAWISTPGNFYGSLVWHTAVPPARYGEYSFVAAVSLLSTIKKFTPEKLTLKWPNDVLLAGRKCAGILIESHDENLIIGIGVNLRHAPPDDAVRTPATALWPEKIPNPKADLEFTNLLIKGFSYWHEQYERDGFEIIRTEWLRHAHHLGQQITVNTPAETITGIFDGIDQQGNLLLTQGDQTRKITTADVNLS
jgi:BirA family biotin operon repressor/biotin-[acetyl-CoA-carboxylase] ligase